MNFLRSFQTKDHFKTEIVGEKDDSSRYFDKDELAEYEESTKKAAEMELILGNALAVHERDNGSIHNLERYGSHSAIEVGRRIATMHSRDEMSASDVHLGRMDSYAFDSRTSSMGSNASLPTFVRVEKGEHSVHLAQQRSWDEDCKTDESITNIAPKPGRKWDKLRREVEEESRHRYVEEDVVPTRRTQSIGKKAKEFRKKILRDSSNRDYGLEQRSERELIRRGYARDYDVEVSLKQKKNFWERKPSIIKAALARKEKSKQNNEAKPRDESRTRQIRQQEVEDSHSFDAPRTDLGTPETDIEENSLVESQPRVIVDMQEMHRGDKLFQALEVACCSSIDGDTLDRITDMVPPHI